MEINQFGMPQNVVPELREGILLWKHYVVINDIVSIVKKSEAKRS